MPMPEKDRQAKAAAKAAPRASKPGAVAVAANEASRLDQRIAEKSRGGSGGGLKDLTEFEQDIAAKQAARPPRAASSGRTSSGSLESDITAKQRARSGNGVASKPGAYAELNAFESDVSSKRNNTLDSDVASKQRARSSGFAKPGAFAEKTNSKVDETELNAFESDVAAKRRAKPAAASSVPGAHPALSNLEDSVVSKSRSAFDEVKTESTELVERQSEISRLDDRIAAKTAAMDEPSKASSKKASKSKSEKAASMPGKEFGSMPQDPGSYYPDKAEQAPGLGGKEDEGARPVTDRGLTSPTDLEDGAFGGVTQDGLAVANLVEEEEEDMFIPAAVEYDPDAKPPMYKNRRFRLYAFLIFFVVVVIAVGVSVGVTVTKDDGEPQPTMAPTTFREGLGIEEQIERVVGSEQLEDPESPYSKALDWIIYEDPMELTVDDENLVQRFTAAYFYYATTVEKPWVSCNPPAWNETSDCDYQKLVGLFPTVYDPLPWTRWLSDKPECSWAGLFCDELGLVRSVELNGQEMNGPFPEGVTNWPFLQSISLAHNELTGQLHPEVANMKHLVSMEVHYNLFSGAIPVEWWKARNLQRINIGDNLLSGSIPPEIAELSDMKGLFLFDNNLYGEYPEEMSELKSLTFFRIQRNALTGAIPSKLATLPSLEEFWSYKNELSGKLPETANPFPAMFDFRVHDNGGLTGEFPLGFYDMSNVFRFDLHNNNFTGTIRSEIGQLENLNVLRISGNNFSGAIPVELADASFISQVWLHDNNFDGAMPAEVCALRPPIEDVATESTGQLGELTADCLNGEWGVDPQVDCPEGCCTMCCDMDGEECLDYYEDV